MKTSISRFRTSWASQQISRIWYAGTQDNRLQWDPRVACLFSLKIFTLCLGVCGISIGTTSWHRMTWTRDREEWSMTTPSSATKTGSITVAMALDKRGCLNGTGAYFLSVQNSWRMWQLQFRRVCWILLEIRITQDIYDMLGCSLFRNQWTKMCRNPMVHNVSTLHKACKS